MLFAAVLILLVLSPVIVRLLGRAHPRVAVGTTTALHKAAAAGNGVEELLKQGANPNGLDEQGRTPLHLSAEHGHMETSKTLLNAGADPNIMDVSGKRALDYALANHHGQTAGIIQSHGGAPARPASASVAEKSTQVAEKSTQGLDPELKYADLPAFEAAIGQPGCLLKSDHVYLFAPKSREEAATIVLPYLQKAYDVLYGIVGVHTKHIIVVYNFPPGHKDAFGGTGNCTLWYDDTNLDLGRQDEWNQYHVPHVCGYIEEMAHNFVDATHAQFGWEMVGWSIGTIASAAVAPNPILAGDLDRTRQKQTETYQRYRAGGFVLPSDIEANKVDRIHAYILWDCEKKYGPNFWKDVFAEIRKEDGSLRAAGDDRDRRYQLTVGCFDRLAGLNFKQRLTAGHISLTRDVKSLKPTEPGWNRQLQ